MKTTRTVVYRGQIYLPGEEVDVVEGDTLTPALGGEARTRGRSRGAVAHQNQTRTIVERQHSRYLSDPRREANNQSTEEQSETDNSQPEAQLTAAQRKAAEKAASDEKKD